MLPETLVTLIWTLEKSCSCAPAPGRKSDSKKKKEATRALRFKTLEIGIFLLILERRNSTIPPCFASLRATNAAREANQRRGEQITRPSTHNSELVERLREN